MKQTTARALWIEAPGKACIRNEVLSEPGPGELRIRTRYSAVSRGTETLVYTGAVPRSEYPRMRAPFQAGTLPGPVKHGYANVGIVEAGPSAWLGRAVFCLYPHQTRYIAPIPAVVPLPEGVPEQRAVLAANMETAVNILWDAGPRVGDRISIVGAGVVGCLLATLCSRLPGAHVELIDVDTGRAKIADALGVSFADLQEAAQGRDLVLHASGNPAGLNTALALAGREAQIIEASWFGTRTAPLNLGGHFHSQRLTLRASQVGHIAPSRAARWNHARRLALAVELCADARLDALFAPDAPFETLPDVMARLADPADRTLGQRIVYPEGPACTT